jgi:hypothetical protein
MTRALPRSTSEEALAPPAPEGSIIWHGAERPTFSLPDDGGASFSIMRKVASKHSRGAGSEHEGVPPPNPPDLSPDVRLCSTCQETDSSPDPVDGKPRAWSYPPKNGRNQGFFCSYCGRVWHARYRARYSTLPKLGAALGEDQELLKTFREEVAFLISKCVAAKTRTITITLRDLPGRGACGT